MKLFARLEADGFARGNADFGTRAWVAPDTCLTGADTEDSETAEFDAFTCCQGLLEPLKHRIDGRFCFSSRQAGALDHMMNNILLDQWRSLLVNLDGSVWSVVRAHLRQQLKRILHGFRTAGEEEEIVLSGRCQSQSTPIR